ncbi:universal stress protein [Salinadaptatus halalkaliphilus]|uniref:Universal stress protein n=1 Tax=Salinadaptatus halalkaliphilus TaxID=2419781 RepID=A0A4S3TS69_9EURY|nr:universal stress protein [Salinadaptatus halalkaliphilus]THE66213.1 universal stress protein [Salinadaptatus halalkaliphilus]
MVVIAAVDRSARSSGVVERGAELADAFEDELHVVHVLSVAEFRDIQLSTVEDSTTQIDVDRVESVAAEQAADAAEAVDRPSQAVGLVGDPSNVLLEYAEEVDARYVVLGPRRRSPAGKAVFGSTSQSVILNAPCPVVTTMLEE